MNLSRILAFTQQDLPETLRLLELMVGLESPSFDKRLVDEFVGFLGSEFGALGGAVTRVPVDRFGDHLVVRFTGESSGSVLLLGHTDTVFPAGETAKRPFRIVDGRATGPGVFDMKAGIALMWSALRALWREGALPRNITVLLTSDEEIGSTSSRELLQSEASKAAAVLVLEPSLPGGALKTARKGVGRFTIKAVGRAAHAGIDPESGVNAIQEISEQVLALHRLTNRAAGTTVTVGVIQGGTRSNVVPAEAAVEVDVRVSTLDEASRVTEAIRSLRPAVAGASLEVRGGINRPPMERSADTVRLFQTAASVAAALGIALQEGATGGASDGNLTAALGIPTLDGLGAVGDGAHSIDEYVQVDSIPLRAALIAGLLGAV